MHLSTKGIQLDETNIKKQGRHMGLPLQIMWIIPFPHFPLPVQRQILSKIQGHHDIFFL